MICELWSEGVLRTRSWRENTQQARDDDEKRAQRRECNVMSRVRILRRRAESDAAKTAEGVKKGKSGQNGVAC